MSPRVSSPMGWMYDLPTGEVPGWTQSRWSAFEISKANVWNSMFQATHKSSGKVLSYLADYEQNNYIVQFGTELTSTLMFSVDLPFADRDGGGLDAFIDRFHEWVSVERFQRHHQPTNRRRLEVKTDGVDRLGNSMHGGLGNFKLRLKFWPLQWRGAGTEGSPGCPCGVSLSLQQKFPLLDPRGGLSSGSGDTSLLTHFGVPLWWDGGFWVTGGVTFLGDNPPFSDWPMHRQIYMYEIAFDLALGRGWGVVAQFRSESPFMDEAQLEFKSGFAPDTREYKYERMRSGWNALTHWRSYETLGFRKRWGGGNELGLFVVEDGGLGDREALGDWMYVHNAPDVQGVLQLKLGF